MPPEAIFTRASKLWVDADGILRGESLPGVEETLSDTEEFIRVIASEFGEEKKWPLLMDIRKLRSISREAREYHAKPIAAKNVTRFALLVESPFSRVLGSFFLRLNKPQRPMQLFTSERRALAWLRDNGE